MSIEPSQISLVQTYYVSYLRQKYETSQNDPEFNEKAIKKFQSLPYEKQVEVGKFLKLYFELEQKGAFKVDYYIN